MILFYNQVKHKDGHDILVCHPCETNIHKENLSLGDDCCIGTFRFISRSDSGIHFILVTLAGCVLFHEI
jgi:hypothetical protein